MCATGELSNAQIWNTRWQKYKIMENKTSVKAHELVVVAHLVLLWLSWPPLTASSLPLPVPHFTPSRPVLVSCQFSSKLATMSRDIKLKISTHGNNIHSPLSSLSVEYFTPWKPVLEPVFWVISSPIKTLKQYLWFVKVTTHSNIYPLVCGQCPSLSIGHFPSSQWYKEAVPVQKYSKIFKIYPKTHSWQ